MNRTGKKSSIIPIDGMETAERWIPVPNPSAGSLRLKSLYRRRGNCYFAPGIPRQLMTFIYRAVLKIRLKDTVLIFSRGAVKKRGRSRKDMVSITELDWAVGTSVIVPKSLKKDERISVELKGDRYTVSTMELIVLAGLFRLAEPGKAYSWHYSMAVLALCHGWKYTEKKDPPRFSIIT